MPALSQNKHFIKKIYYMTKLKGTKFISEQICLAAEIVMVQYFSKSSYFTNSVILLVQMNTRTFPTTGENG